VHAQIGRGLGGRDLDQGRITHIARMSRTQDSQLVAHRVGGGHGGAAAEIEDTVDFPQIIQGQPWRWERHQGRPAARFREQHQVALARLALDLDDPPRSSDAILVGQGMSCQGHLDAPKVHTVALSGVNMPLGDAFPQHVLDSLRHPLRRFAAAHHIDMIDLG